MDLKDALGDTDITYQRFPSHNHRTNLAERVIQTVKTRFVAGLASIYPYFPLNKWDRVLEQGEITLNLLWAFRPNPKLSAYAYMFS